jgi:hypothetical protein
VRIKQLEEELDQRRATTPALAEAAARSEVEQLTRELAAKQAELDAALGARAAPAAAPGAAAPLGARSGFSALTSTQLWMAGGSFLLALAGGFWLGYAALARRIKHKFGGLKVY